MQEARLLELNYKKKRIIAEYNGKQIRFNNVSKYLLGVYQRVMTLVEIGIPMYESGILDEKPYAIVMIDGSGELVDLDGRKEEKKRMKIGIIEAIDVEARTLTAQTALQGTVVFENVSDELLAEYTHLITLAREDGRETAICQLNQKGELISMNDGMEV
ncbi:MAG: hypothetical protein ACRC17_10100 [Culicoidibacterales bacterium]